MTMRQILQQPVTAKKVSSIVAFASVTVAIPAAILMEPVLMGIAAGAATAAAYTRFHASKPTERRNSNTPDRRALAR
jgi:hypothetical protein